jgi:hypothetical protein
VAGWIDYSPVATARRPLRALVRWLALAHWPGASRRRSGRMRCWRLPSMPAAQPASQPGWRRRSSTSASWHCMDNRLTPYAPASCWRRAWSYVARSMTATASRRA